MLYPASMRHKRIVAGILGMLMLFFTLFSAFYIIAEADHDCTGDDCPICACIHQCEDTIYQTADRIVPQITIVLPVTFILVTVFHFAIRFSQETLVSRKIRLNN